MSVTITGTGGWANRMGSILYEFTRAEEYLGTPTEASVSAIYSHFSTDDQIAVEGLYGGVSNHRSQFANWLQNMRDVAVKATIEQVNRDDPLATKTIDAAIDQLIEQFKDESESIARPTVTATPASNGANVGDAILRVSVVDPRDGGQLDHSFAEIIKLKCTSDVSAGATEFQESVSYEGDPTVQVTDYRWPAGSGCRGNLTITNGEGTHLVTDGGFEEWTGSVPDNWTVVAGGATLAKGTAFRGSGSLQITSDGSTETRVRSGNLISSLQPQTAYALNLFAKISAVAAGTLVVKLVDGSGTTIQDEAGADNELSIDTNSDLSSSYAAFGEFFRLPRDMPDAAYLDIHLTAPPTSGRVISVDTLALVGATSLYPGGPLAAMFSGATRNVRDDRWTLTVTNNHDTGNFSLGLERLFDLRIKGKKFPSVSSGETVPDSLIAQG